MIVIEDRPNHAWSYFLKEKSELNDVIFVLLKDIKAILGIDASHVHCYNSNKNEDFGRLCKKKRWVLNSSTLCPVHNRKMEELNRNFLCFSLGYKLG